MFIIKTLHVNKAMYYYYYYCCYCYYYYFISIHKCFETLLDQWEERILLIHQSKNAFVASNIL